MLRADIYATAALVGAGVVVIGNLLLLPSLPVALVGAVLCFALRMVAIRRGWNLPTAVPGEAGAPEAGSKNDRSSGH